jgi:hypothetical protein
MTKNLALLHRLEEGALHLGRCPVNFVGEHQIGEDRPAVGGEFAGFGLEDHGAHDIGGQEVGGKLDALKLHPESGTE